MSNSRGILIVAIGHPYYGRMAHNLAVSIKAADPSMQIALVHAGNALNHLSEQQLSKAFDHFILAPYGSYTKDSAPHYIKAKTCLYDFSPFDTTLCLDADMLWLPRKQPGELFDQLKDFSFTMANHDTTGTTNVWANAEQIRAAYDVAGSNLYSFSSEVVYFTRCDENEKYFNLVKEVWERPKVSVASFAGSIPDEFAYVVASALLNRPPHQSPWHPSFWFAANTRKPAELEYIYQNFFLLSIGGNVIPERIQTIYNRLATAYFNKLKLTGPWHCKNKRQFIKERV